MKKNRDYIWAKIPEGEEVKEEPSPLFVEIVNNRIYFYSSIDMERILKLNREIRELEIDLQRKAMNESREPANIFLHIQSYGGSVFAGLSGLDAIKKSSIPVYTIVDGCCASAGTFLSIVGKKRFINKHAYMLIHQLKSIMWGKYSEFQDEMKNLDKIMNMIKEIYAEHTKIPMEKLEEILKHDLWFTANECLKYGLVDEIIE